ncbi:lipopolysaccharide biosynthesis protein [uncultured Fibrella sp.]|uniref:lipopolysaccharide biosynthesis protein n=1 Tax=uncultured Fibrella sp. TaxID=1284596 RepID=UPI0035C9D4AB
MSTAKRVLSGTVAAWARIGVTMVSQILLVPIFLTYWDLETYGVWIAIQAFINILSTFDRGFNDYLEFEFLKIGAENKAEISALLYSAFGAMVVIGLAEFIIVLGLVFGANSTSWLFNTTSKTTSLTVCLAVVIQWGTWTLTNGVGMFTRLMSAFGHYHRMTWWGVLIAAVSSIAQIGPVVLGGGLIEASLMTAVVTIPLLALQLLSIIRILQREEIFYSRPALSVGIHRFGTSMLLSLRYFLDNFQQQGIRLFIAPVLGVVSLATFSTTRTSANVILQGLTTIAYPIMPEMMRFLHQRNQQKLEMTFDTIWFMVIAVLAPAIVVIQSVGGLLFHEWTRGKIEFNPLLFASLSLSVLVYGFAQVAMAVLKGNNLLKKQLILSLCASATLLGMLVALLPTLNLFGAGLALLAAESMSAFIAISIASKWLNQHQLHWPRRKSQLVIISLLITAVGLITMSSWTEYEWQIMLGTLLFLAVNTFNYWKAMANETTHAIQQTMGRYIKNVKGHTYNL